MPGAVDLAATKFACFRKIFATKNMTYGFSLAKRMERELAHTPPVSKVKNTMER